MKYIIRGETEQRNMLEHVGQMRLAGKVPEVTIKEYDPDRSLDQNALIYCIYPEIAKQKEDETTRDVMRRLKLHHGVPILRSQDVEFRVFYNKALLNLDYESKLAAMDFVPITSRMKKAQCTEYIESVLKECAEQGIDIRIPFK